MGVSGDNSENSIAMQQTILITGATSGFGWACSELFAAKGWRLIACGRREERLRELQARLPEAEIHPYRLDVRESRQIEEMPVCQSWAPFAMHREQQKEMTGCDG